MAANARTTIKTMMTMVPFFWDLFSGIVEGSESVGLVISSVIVGRGVIVEEDVGGGVVVGMNSRTKY